MSSWREVSANFKMKTYKSLSKSALDTQSLLYLNATEKMHSSLNQYPKMIKKTEFLKNK